MTTKTAQSRKSSFNTLLRRSAVVTAMAVAAVSQVGCGNSSSASQAKQAARDVQEVYNTVVEVQPDSGPQNIKKFVDHFRILQVNYDNGKPIVVRPDGTVYNQFRDDPVVANPVEGRIIGEVVKIRGYDGKEGYAYNLSFDCPPVALYHSSRFQTVKTFQERNKVAYQCAVAIQELQRKEAQEKQVGGSKEVALSQ